MPMSDGFKKRLFPVLPDIVAHFGTPFHLYDEAGIRETGSELKRQFATLPGFREFFAVKALPNPDIMAIMQDMEFGFDCSSVPELVLSRQIGARGEAIMFTSNNTTEGDLAAATADGGSIINLDDISLIDRLPAVPELICFRYNPGARRTGNDIIGNPVEAKYGVSDEQICDAYKRMRDLGTKRFGLHTMLVSNERNCSYMLETIDMLLELVDRIGNALAIRFEFINMGGGLGIPYRPEESPLDLHAMAGGIIARLNRFQQEQGYSPRLFMESGRYMTGPHGVLVTRVINRKSIYRQYVGVDACMSALMRPGIYGAYHHIDVYGKDMSNHPTETVDVVGALCENIDKFAVQRDLPKTDIGDLVVIHDTGAHGHAMGFNYNAQLRPKELLLKTDGSVWLIRREETMADYFATLAFDSNVLRMKPDQ